MTSTSSSPRERTAASRAYYVIGTEDELLKKGVIVKEGGDESAHQAHRSHARSGASS